MHRVCFEFIQAINCGFSSKSSLELQLAELNVRVAKAVKKSGYKLYWKNGDSNMSLHSDRDLKNAIKNAMERSRTGNPCIQIGIKTYHRVLEKRDFIDADRAVCFKEIISARLAQMYARKDVKAELSLVEINDAVPEVDSAISTSQSLSTSHPVACATAASDESHSSDAMDEGDDQEMDRVSTLPAVCRQALSAALNKRNARRTVHTVHPYRKSSRAERYESRTRRLNLRSSSDEEPSSPPSIGTSDTTVTTEVIVIEDDDDELPAIVPAAAPHPWLLLENSRNDCFLNAGLQYMRRASDLRSALDKWKQPEPANQQEADKACVLRMLHSVLAAEGKVSSFHFRDALSEVIIGLEPLFLSSQQDAYEILTKIWDQLIPSNIEKMFHIESVSRKRCRDNENCKGTEKRQSGAIHYQHIERNNQILDLEATLSTDWTTVDGETEPRHCSACCPCCQAKVEGHDEEKCGNCKADRKSYVEETRHTFTGSSDYALVAFNILHADKRVGWALKENCDLNGMKLMGLNWKAVSIIKHTGSASGGHYVTYTREDDGLWWIHDDDRVPISTGERFVQKSKFPYGEGMTDMKGVVAILFQKCS